MKDIAYCIDLDSPKPQVLELSGQALTEDMELIGTRKIEELSDYDRKVFKNESDADKYLDKYSQVMRGLTNDKICKSRQLPAMLYKRRYIVQTLLGEKLQTYRHYRKNWKSGQLFNLHDQTFFLTVRLVSITETPDGDFKYKFELP